MFNQTTRGYAMQRQKRGVRVARASEIDITWMAGPGSRGTKKLLGVLTGGAKSRASFLLEKRGNNFTVTVFGGAWEGGHKVIASGPTPDRAKQQAVTWVKANLS